MDSEAPFSKCNICGGTDFSHGPSKRLSITRRLPHCSKCSSLERHRIARRIFDRLKPNLEGKRVLQFSPDPALEQCKLAELVVSIWQGANSLDIQAIDVPNGRYDWIYSSHVLNHVPDTSAALREMLRVVGEGVVVLSVGGTVFNFATRPSDRQMGQDYQFVLYGTQFADEIASVLPEVAILELVAADPCTASIDSIYLYSLSEAMLSEMARQAVGDNIHAHLFPPRARRVALAQDASITARNATTVAEAAFTPCNICSATQFSPGPGHRLSSPHNRLPRCTRCLSLERHRIRRRIFEALAPACTEGKRLLQFENEPGLREEWFDEVLVSVRHGKNSLDLLATELPESSYDWVCSSHLVSDAPEDRAALREMLRVAGPEGIVALTVKGSASGYEGVRRLESEADLASVRQHGLQFVEDVQHQLPDVALLELVTTDPCTASVDAMYFCARDPVALERIARLVQDHGIHTRFFPISPHSAPTQTASSNDWDKLLAEIDAWRASGHRPRFWIRDDDAEVYSDKLARLADLCGEEQVPLALAVIPARAAADLGLAVDRRSGITVLQHGFDHRNRSAPPGRSEFPEERPVNDALDAVRLGWSKLRESFGDKAFPVFVPPWGNCSTELQRALPGLGIVGFSGGQVGPFHQAALWRRGIRRSAEGLTVASAHISVNRNKHGESSEPPTGRHVRFLTKLVRAIRSEGDDRDEPIGIMTHAWGVDASVRDFLRQLFRKTRDGGAEWVSARDVFAP
jgi:ubiquinone/menaquinone biosynthesis C-methylase UbiE